jgi:mono/diheme cytochrome c family protein
MKNLENALWIYYLWASPLVSEYLIIAIHPINKNPMKKKRLWKILGFVVLGLIVILFIGIGYIVWFQPRIPVQDIRVNATADQIERGQYLANHVMVCIDCHSTRDWTKFSGPVISGTEGKGGEKFDQSLGFPGIFVSANITPYHLSGWSDGELYRAITSGVGKGNRPFFPVMPYLFYGMLDTEDIYSVMAYIRTLKSIQNDPEVSNPDFPVNIMLHLIPAPAHPSRRPEISDSLNYGKYLVLAGSCIECHTQADKKGKLIEWCALPISPLIRKPGSGTIPRVSLSTGSRLMIPLLIPSQR